MDVTGNLKRYFSDLRLANHVELFKIAGARKIVYRIFICLMALAFLWCLISCFLTGSPSARDVLEIALVFFFLWFWLRILLVSSHIVIKDGMLTFVDYLVRRRSFAVAGIVSASRGYLEVNGNAERVLRFAYAIDAERDFYGYFDIFMDYYSNDDVVMMCRALGYDGLVLQKVAKHARGDDVLVAGLSDDERKRSIAEEEADKEFYRNFRRKQVRKMPMTIVLSLLFAVAVLTLTCYLTRLF